MWDTDEFDSDQEDANEVHGGHCLRARIHLDTDERFAKGLSFAVPSVIRCADPPQVSMGEQLGEQLGHVSAIVSETSFVEGARGHA